MGKAKTKKPRRGRPPSAEPKTKRYMVRIAPDFLAACEAVAKHRGFGSAGAWFIALAKNATTPTPAEPAV